MLREHIEKYYQDDYNCAESMLLGANAYYDLDLKKEDVTLVGGLGGGMCTRRTCGALSGGICAIGRKIIRERAHQTEELKPLVQRFTARFEEVFGTDQCDRIKEDYPEGCLPVVLQAADVLEEVLREFGVEAHA